jgi:ATP-dependent Clp protease ATP-binding subunit ClpC
VDTEHILLAMIEQPEGVVGQLLQILKVDSGVLAERLDKILRTTPKANIFGGGSGQVFITPRVKMVVDRANDEANRLSDEYISTEHIFLAILGEKNTQLARLLDELGLNRQRVLDAVTELRGVRR